jgi:hypothetical protein
MIVLSHFQQLHGMVIRLLIAEEVQNISQGACISLIDFGVLTARARNGRKLFVLDVKEFRKASASCSKLAFFVFIILTFWAFPILVLHVTLRSRH